MLQLRIILPLSQCLAMVLEGQITRIREGNCIYLFLCGYVVINERFSFKWSFPTNGEHTQCGNYLIKLLKHTQITLPLGCI